MCACVAFRFERRVCSPRSKLRRFNVEVFTRMPEWPLRPAKLVLWSYLLAALSGRRCPIAQGDTENMDELLREGIRLFNNGEFFACHEVLEEAWTRERGPRRVFLQAIIHVAVGLYHCQRGNPAGGGGQLGKALRKLAFYLPSYECIDTTRLYADALAVARRTEAGSPILEYPRINLTLAP